MQGTILTTVLWYTVRKTCFAVCFGEVVYLWTTTGLAFIFTLKISVFLIMQSKVMHIVHIICREISNSKHCCLVKQFSEPYSQCHIALENDHFQSHLCTNPPFRHLPPIQLDLVEHSMYCCGRLVKCPQFLNPKSNHKGLAVMRRQSSHRCSHSRPKG